VDVDGKRLLTRAVALAAVITAVGANPAAAAVCLPDQTVAVLDQYCETPLNMIGVPAPSDSGADRAKALSVALPPAEASRIRQAGPAGRALLLLPAAAPLASAGVTRAERRRAAAGARKVVSSGQLKRPASEVRGFANGLVAAAGDAVDGAFRWGLVICSFGLAGMSWLRLRTRLKL
jgi:hypothetical protein